MKALSIVFSSFQRCWGVVLVLAVVFSGCASLDRQWDVPPAANPDLAAHSAEFRQEVIEVTDGVYVAIGFGLANSVLIEGDDQWALELADQLPWLDPAVFSGKPRYHRNGGFGYLAGNRGRASQSRGVGHPGPRGGRRDH